VRRRRLLSALCACLLLLIVGAAAQADDVRPVQYRGKTNLSPAEQRLTTDAQLAMRRLDHWLRPFPYPTLTIVDAPWFSPRVGTATGGEVVTPQKMLASPRDRAAARALVAGLTTLYWPRLPDDAFSAGVRDYVATRVFHDQFSGTHYFTVDLLGGFATHAIRAVPLTRRPYDARPPVRHFPETSDDPAAARVVDAMFTLERYVGWPTVQYAVADWLSHDESASSLDLLEQSLERATGRDLRWFTRRAFDASVRYDYGAVALTSRPSPADDWFEIDATVTRRGSGSFPVDVEVVFADGSRLRERWQGEESSTTWKYRSRSPASALVVDPDLVLLLDADRSNNAHVEKVSPHVPAMRWTLQWATWLQNVLLTATALI
jgi:hypothetical protein